MGGFAATATLARDILGVRASPMASGVATWFLIGIFLLSGTGKLRQPVLAAMAMVDFGVLRRVHPRLGWALGTTEVALACVLVLDALGRVGFLRLPPVIAAALLWLFVLLIARALRAGEHFACCCFGDVGSSLSPWTLARTAILALLATGLALSPPNALQWPSGSAVVLEALIAAALLGMIALGLRILDLVRWDHAIAGGRRAVRT